jgi:predicted HicB family RNase H-like nuclease
MEDFEERKYRRILKEHEFLEFCKYRSEESKIPINKTAHQ